MKDLATRAFALLIVTTYGAFGENECIVRISPATLVGEWQGMRPTSNRAGNWKILYFFEFRPDGSYTYVARQVSDQRGLWVMKHEGRYRLLPRATPPKDRYTPTHLLELTPSEGANPPTEEDRIALYESLGLPDFAPRQFTLCYRNTGSPPFLDMKPKDADQRSSERGWYLNRKPRE